MHRITATELRTKTNELIKTLENGASVDLIHRSKVVAKVEPVLNLNLFNQDNFKKELENFQISKTTHQQRLNLYQKRLSKKYGSK